MSHTTTRTWRHPIAGECASWNKTRKKLGYLYPKTAMLPWDWPKWIVHRSRYNEWDLKRKIQRFETLQESRRAEREHPITPAFGNKEFKEKGGLVLGLETMWTPYWDVPERYGGQIWPSQEELRFEGDERVKTGYRRFLPIVRNWQPDNSTVSWKFMRELPFHEFDAVDKSHIFMGLESGPVQEIGLDEAEYYLGQDLARAVCMSEEEYPRSGCLEGGEEEEEEHEARRSRRL